MGSVDLDDTLGFTSMPATFFFFFFNVYFLFNLTKKKPPLNPTTGKNVK